MRTVPERTLRPALAACALLIAGCGGSTGGGCQLPAKLPALIGTPIPAQPIPAGANTSTAATVTVKVVVDRNGAVTSATVVKSSNNAVLDSTALALVRQSQFSPGMAGCGTSPAPDTVTVSVSFLPR